MVHLRKTIHKTKSYFQKSLKHFKSFFSRGYYQKLPKSLSFHCNVDNASDQFYNEFYDHLQSDISTMKMYGNNNINISKSKESAMEDATRNGDLMCFAKQSSQKITCDSAERAKTKRSTGSQSQLRKREDNMNKRVHILAQKMKEMDMVNAGDLEHVLDIEEVLHYYSRLKSPIYLDIVDKFFSDINSEFSVPHSSVSLKNSKERVGPIQLHKR